MRLAAVALAALVLLGAGASTAAAARPPNVVLVVADDIGWGDYGFMGHPTLRTPSIDRLAAEGLAFTRGYVPTSTCRPSLATLATGLYPHQHGITGNGPGGDERDPVRQRIWWDLFDRSPTLPEQLAAAGYVTIQTGKWWEGPYQRAGFQHGMTSGDVEGNVPFGDEGIVVGRQPLAPLFDQLGALGDDQPFFLWFAPMLPHEPHDPPERLLERYRAPGRPIEIARYYAMVAWLDEAVGELLAFLDASGRARDTLVVYLADNGWIQSVPTYKPGGVPPWGLWGRAKLSPYDAGVRTPILVRWPGRVAPRRDDTHPVSSVDVVPTILSAAGLAPPPALPGLDLRAAAAVAGREAVFGEIFARAAVEPERPLSSLKVRWVVAGRWKLVEPYLPNWKVPLKTFQLGDESGWVSNERISWLRRQTELYDVVADPGEEHDVAARHPDVVAALRSRLDAWWPESAVPAAASGAPPAAAR